MTSGQSRMMIEEGGHNDDGGGSGGVGGAEVGNDSIVTLVEDF